ncbi:MAG: 30S ribosomal protein S12 methylthiotransferase RimO [Oscillospiraceae bacterium]|nr:30S ribosomal protein S12 methylthiotransferase RimO [Oscillospiraceae bacterium]
MNKTVKVALIAMGCEKNVINSEQMLHLLHEAGFATTSDPSEADVTVINTCAFIESARQEALEQIFEVMETDSKIILAGCLAEYHKLTPVKGLPAVDGYIGTGRFDSVVDAVIAVLDGQMPICYGNLNTAVSETPRLHTGPPHTAYIKIAEGCDNRCSYCIIPALRGPFRPRPQEAIVREAKSLIGDGVTELILVAQDVTRYPSLPELLDDLCGIAGLRRVRLHYLYPERITDELIETIAAEPKIARYLDIPMQHASDRVLKAMNRRYSRADLERLIMKLRERIPGVVLRTSIITGFPGETKDDFEELLQFLQWAQIPRIGVFAYSREAGTAADGLLLQVTEKVKKQRQRRVEILQSRVIDAFNREREGHVAEVLTEGYDSYCKLYFGRSDAESPDVDGLIFFTSEKPVVPGEWVKILLDGAIEGDGKGRRLE